jgi:hypothetical protein
MTDSTHGTFNFMKNIYVLLGWLLLLTGCSKAPPVVLTLKAESANPQIVAASRDILENRFKEFLPTMFSSVNSTIHSSTIRFEFRNGAPKHADLVQLFSTPGRLIVSLHSPTGHGAIWYTDKDIENATSKISNDEKFIAIKLTEKAAKRVKRLSSQNIGNKIDVTLDDRIILQAVIRGTLGRYSEFNAPDPDKALYLAAILKYGHLPAKMVEVR